MKKFLCTLLLAAALPAFAQERFASRPVRPARPGGEMGRGHQGDRR
jgi:hypothetical protein